MEDALSIQREFSSERFTADTVPALVCFLVEVVRGIVEDLLDEALHTRFVRRIRGPNKLIVGDTEQAPDLLGALSDRVDQLLRRDFSLDGGLRDFLTVLVHPDQEVDIVAFQSVVTSNRV